MEAVYYFMFLNLKESHWDSETAGIRGMWGALFFSWEHFITEAVSAKPLAHNLGLEAMEEEAFLQLLASLKFRLPRGTPQTRLPRTLIP